MSHETPVQPKLGDLLARYLEKQAEACAVGAAASADEVTPYEAGPVQPINPKLAWDEALAVFSLAGTTTNVRGWKAPPQWSSMVTGHEPVLALALPRKSSAIPRLNSTTAVGSCFCQLANASAARPECQARAAFSFSHAPRHSAGIFASCLRTNCSATSSCFANRKAPRARSNCGS